MGVRPCQHCHGTGKNTVWDEKKKTYVTQPCWPCGGTGKADPRLI